MCSVRTDTTQSGVALRIVLTAICFSLMFSSWAGAAAPAEKDQAVLAHHLLQSLGCRACHAFEDSQAQLGPGLHEISKGLNRTELAQSLVNPEHQHGKGLIPDFSYLRDEEIDALVTFLHGLLPEGEKTTPNLRSAPTDESAQPNISKP